MGERRLNLHDQNDLTGFLRELVQIPSPSTREDPVAQRIVAEMTRLGFEDVHIDRMGSVVGRVGPGHGPVLMLNGHMDTVEVSAPECWDHPPYGAEIRDGTLFGIGACDMKGGLAAMIYGVKLLIDSGADLAGDIVVACVVQEEPSEGLGTRALIEDEGIRPDWVVLAEPTNLDVARGHRGRLEMRLTADGRAAHAACPDLGDNAIYTAARLVFGLELLSGQLGTDDFLGPGSLSVTAISSRACSRNAVPDQCEVIIDRRLTLGENEAKAIAEVQRVITREGVQARVEVTEYETTSYTGTTRRTRQCYPAWVIAEDHPLVAAAVQAVRTQLKVRPQVTRWSFSTEGAYTAGSARIPTVGFGPGEPNVAHTANEHVRLADVHSAAEVYAQLASILLGER
ncbi:MAG: YgeY family selenium metabolism-linked hydrolase [Chloroflexi bacterium]|nr:YgeY family selenium metabolism-linked hydrolase [Chloroflexota bacterium]